MGNGKRARAKLWRLHIKLLQEQAHIEDTESEDPAIEAEKLREKLCFAGFDEEKFGIKI